MADFTNKEAVCVDVCVDYFVNMKVFCLDVLLIDVFFLFAGENAVKG